MPLDTAKFGYTITERHAKKPPTAKLKAHVLGLFKGWTGEIALQEYVTKHPVRSGEFGFAADDISSQPALWRVRANRLDDEQFAVLCTIAVVLVEVVRDHDVSGPYPVFTPDCDRDTAPYMAPETETETETVTELTIEKTKAICQHVNPDVEAGYALDRAENTEIPESAWWEAHAFVDTRSEMYANDGLRSFTADTTRRRVQSGSHHRAQLKKVSAEDARRSHRHTVEQVIARAKGAGEPARQANTAIDITKSNPSRNPQPLAGWHDDPAHRNGTEPWILGYKSDDATGGQSIDYYFQWATIQIFGFAIPLVLDAVPVDRGMSRQEIGDELLSSGTDLVNIELVMTDRVFDADWVKDANEATGLTQQTALGKATDCLVASSPRCGQRKLRRIPVVQRRIRDCTPCTNRITRP